MSQSRFSIVLVGVSALLRRPLVSRLRPADGERSPWVVFTARVGRFDSGFRLPLRRFPSAGWPSDSRLPFFGTHRFGVATRRVGLRVHRFRFSARTASEIAAGRVGLRAHCFRFSARAASELPLGGLVLPPSASGLPSASWPSGSPLPLFGTHRFGDCPRRVRSSAFRFGDCRSVVGLRIHRFRFSARTVSEWPLGGLAFGFTASAFRPAPLRSGRRASLPSGSRLPLFGMHRSAPPRRRREDRRSTPTRHLFHFKTLIPTC